MNLVQENLGELIGILNGILITGVEVSKKNLPIMLQQILNYSLYQAYFGIGLGILLAIGSFLLFKKGYKMQKENEYSAYDLVLVSAILCLLFFLITFLLGLLTVIEIKTSPIYFMLVKVKRLI